MKRSLKTASLAAALIVLLLLALTACSNPAKQDQASNPPASPGTASPNTASPGKSDENKPDKPAKSTLGIAGMTKEEISEIFMQVPEVLEQELPVAELFPAGGEVTWWRYDRTEGKRKMGIGRAYPQDHEKYVAFYTKLLTDAQLHEDKSENLTQITGTFNGKAYAVEITDMDNPARTVAAVDLLEASDTPIQAGDVLPAAFFGELNDAETCLFVMSFDPAQRTTAGFASAMYQSMKSRGELLEYYAKLTEGLENFSKNESAGRIEGTAGGLKMMVTVREPQFFIGKEYPSEVIVKIVKAEQQ